MATFARRFSSPHLIAVVVALSVYVAGWQPALAQSRSSRSRAADVFDENEARAQFAITLQETAVLDQRISDWNRQWWISTGLWCAGFLVAVTVFQEKGFFGFIAFYCFWSAAGFFPNHTAIGRLISLLVGGFCALCLFSSTGNAEEKPAQATNAALGEGASSRRKTDEANQFLAKLSQSSRVS